MRAIPFVLLMCALGVAGSGCKDAARKETNDSLENVGGKLAVADGRTTAPAATPTAAKTTAPFTTDGDITSSIPDGVKSAEKKIADTPILPTAKIEESITKSVETAKSDPTKIEMKKEATPPAVAEQALELVCVLRRGDDEDVTNAREHQRRQRIIDHRLVVDRQDLFAGREREGIEPCARSARENDPLHALLTHAMCFFSRR